MTEVLEHLKSPLDALREVYRILKDNGLLLLTTPMTWPIHERPNDFFRYTQFGLEYLLKEAGFKEFKINASNGFIYTILQLINSVLRNKIFSPLVMIINLLGVIIFKTKLDFYYDLPLGYQVIAFKSKTK